MLVLTDVKKTNPLELAGWNPALLASCSAGSCSFNPMTSLRWYNETKYLCSSGSSRMKSWVQWSSCVLTMVSLLWMSKRYSFGSCPCICCRLKPWTGNSQKNMLPLVLKHSTWEYHPVSWLRWHHHVSHAPPLHATPNIPSWVFSDLRNFGKFENPHNRKSEVPMISHHNRNQKRKTKRNTRNV